MQGRTHLVPELFQTLGQHQMPLQSQVGVCVRRAITFAVLNVVRGHRLGRYGLHFRHCPPFQEQLANQEMAV